MEGFNSANSQMRNLIRVLETNFFVDENLNLRTILKRTIVFQDSEITLIEILNRITTLIDLETHQLCRTDPLIRLYPSDPESPLQQMITELNRRITNQIVFEYLTCREASSELLIASCCLLLKMMPSCQMPDHFIHSDCLIQNLVAWSINSPDPLAWNATGLLSYAMKISKIVNSYKDMNVIMVPLIAMKLESLASNPPAKSKAILNYLQTMLTWQEYISTIPPLSLFGPIITFILQNHEEEDGQLAFEALELLKVILKHRHLAKQFITSGSIDRLMDIRRLPILDVGVSQCLICLTRDDEMIEMVVDLTTRLVDVIRFLLEMLKSGRRMCWLYSIKFFILGIRFKVILRIFKELGGVQYLLDECDLLTTKVGDVNYDGEEFACQSLSALRKFMEAILAEQCDDVRGVASAVNKAFELTPERYDDNIALLRTNFFSNSCWSCIKDFMAKDGLLRLIQLLRSLNVCGEFTGRSEMLKNILETINICCLMPSARRTLFSLFQLLEGKSTCPLTVILEVAFEDSSHSLVILKAVLNVLISFFSGRHKAEVTDETEEVADEMMEVPNKIMEVTYETEDETGDEMEEVTDEETDEEIEEEIDEETDEETDEEIDEEAYFTEVWNVAKNCNVMWNLCEFFKEKTIGGNISVRTLVCHALLLLSDCEDFRKYLNTSDIITKNELKKMIMNPDPDVSPLEHASFCCYASSLIELVTGVPVFPSCDKIKRIDLLSHCDPPTLKTKLLSLIHKWLLEQNRFEAAKMLIKELKDSDQAGGVSEYITTPDRSLLSAMFIGCGLELKNLNFPDHQIADDVQADMIEMPDGQEPEGWDRTPSTSQDQQSQQRSTEEMDTSADILHSEKQASNRADDNLSEIQESMAAKRYSFVTFIDCNDDAFGALALSESIKNLSKIPLVCIYTEKVSVFLRARLRKEIRCFSAKQIKGSRDVIENFLLVFLLTQYERCIYIHPQSLLGKNVDFLFGEKGFIFGKIDERRFVDIRFIAFFPSFFTFETLTKIHNQVAVRNLHQWNFQGKVGLKLISGLKAGSYVEVNDDPELIATRSYIIFYTSVKPWEAIYSCNDKGICITLTSPMSETYLNLWWSKFVETEFVKKETEFVKKETQNRGYQIKN